MTQSSSPTPNSRTKLMSPFSDTARYYKEPMVVLEVGHEGSDQSFCDSYVDRAAFSPDETEIVVSHLGPKP